MIQRIQSVYLLLCGLMMAGMFLMPIATYLTHDEQVYEQTVLAIEAYGDQSPAVNVDPMPIGILSGVIALVFLVSIFLFKNRTMQTRLIIFNMVLLLGLLGLIYFYSTLIKSEIDAKSMTFAWINLAPIVSLVLAYISFHRIRLDEALVKSYDRIR